MKSYRFFHGTHSGNLDSILKKGLTPIDSPQSAMRGNMSTLPGFTEKLVFLTPSASEAAFYARAQAEKFNESPVIFETIVHDESFLFVSDDYVLQQCQAKILAACDLSPMEYDEDGDPDTNCTSGDIYFVWREVIDSCKTSLASGEAFSSKRIDDQCFDIFDHHNHDEAKKLWDICVETMVSARLDHWSKSIETDRDPAIGYMGVIPPENLSVLSNKDLDRALNGILRGRGRSVQWEIELPSRVCIRELA